MFNVTDMQNLQIYRNKVALPIGKDSKYMGSLILMNTKDIQGSIKTIKNPNFLGKLHYKAYHIDYLYRLKFFNKVFNERIDNHETYVEITEACEDIAKTYREIIQYKGINVYADLHKYNQFFIDSIGTFKGDRVIEEYLALVKTISAKYSHSYKLMVIDLEEWNVDLSNPENFRFTNADNPFEILVMSMVRFPEIFKQLDFEILLVDGKSSIRIIPSQCDAKSFQELKSNLVRIKQTHDTGSEEVTQPKVAKVSAKTNVRQKIVSKMAAKLNANESGSDIVRFALTGDDEREIPEDVKKKIEDAFDEATQDKDELSEDEQDAVEKTVEDKLNQDQEVLKAVELIKMEKITNASATNMRRNKMLEEKQAEIKVNKSGKTIEDILKEVEDKTIKPKNLKVNTINDKMKAMKLPNFEKEYNEKLLDKDTIAIINFFKSRSIPVYILDIQKEDTSDDFNKKFTYTIKMESADRQRHTVKFDMPKFVNDSFIYLGGNKKTINKQLTLNPVSKTGPDTVQICTNYNKIFITRSGNKVSPKIERLKKALAEYKGTKATIFYREGDNRLSNTNYKTSIEYDELGSNYMEISLFNDVKIYFNQEELRELLRQNKIAFDEKNFDILPIGVRLKNGKPSQIISLNVSTNKIIGDDKSIPDFIIDTINERKPEFKTEMNKLSVGKKYLYSKAKIMHKDVPLLFLLAYLEGLTTVMKKAGIKFEFSDKRVQLKDDDKNNKDIVEFADGYLIYDRYPMANSLLMNALTLIPTKEYEYASLDIKDTYLEIFEDLLGIRMIVNAFDNFYDLLIDPITYEVLQDLNMPTDFTELVLFANTLLEDNLYMRENNMALYRIRSNEVVNVYLYKALADSYSSYRLSAGNKNPVKMSIPQDRILKDILTSNIVEDYSTLNPVLEAEKVRAVTFKGPRTMGHYTVMYN